MICPACGHDNIDGDDTCDKCDWPLADLTRPRGKLQIERRIHKDRIRVLHPKSPVVVSPDAPVGDVLRLMVEKKVGCVVVAEGERLAGIFTERDALLRLNADAAAQATKPVSQFMTAAPETLELEDRIAFALHKMDLGGFRHVPITNDGRVAGVISARDILRYVTENIKA